jgi:hypothetical protein
MLNCINLIYIVDLLCSFLIFKTINQSNKKRKNKKSTIITGDPFIESLETNNKKISIRQLGKKKKKGTITISFNKLGKKYKAKEEGI